MHASLLENVVCSISQASHMQDFLLAWEYVGSVFGSLGRLLEAVWGYFDNFFATALTYFGLSWTALECFEGSWRPPGTVLGLA